MWNSSIWSIDRTLSGASTPSQSGPGNDGNEEVLHIHKSSNTTGGSQSACLVPYPGDSLREGFILYSTAPANWIVKIYNGKVAAR